MSTQPILYVEGKDDISIISALLKRHGVDTKQGDEHLKIIPLDNITKLLKGMAKAIEAATDKPVGFVLDIDVSVGDRWQAVRDRLRHLKGVNVPDKCPGNGFFDKVAGYPYEFGVWLMPDCQTDRQFIEDLCISLIPEHPAWPFAAECVRQSSEMFDKALADDPAKYAHCRQRFKDLHHRKAALYTWLAWQDEPGTPLGAAINATILNHDSRQAIALLRWMKRLYGFGGLNV
jgi:hypothetical protein